MNTHRFYIAAAQWSLNRLALDGSEAHHCVNVLRLGVGSRVVVFNGAGSEVTAEIVDVDKGIVRLKNLQVAKAEPLRCSVTLAQAVPKGKHMDLIVQKATELGVERLKGLDPILAPLVKSGELKVVGAVYDLRTGMVNFLD